MSKKIVVAAYLFWLSGFVLCYLVQFVFSTFLCIFSVKEHTNTVLHGKDDLSEKISCIRHRFLNPDLWGHFLEEGNRLSAIRLLIYCCIIFWSFSFSAISQWAYFFSPCTFFSVWRIQVKYFLHILLIKQGQEKKHFSCTVLFRSIFVGAGGGESKAGVTHKK